MMFTFTLKGYSKFWGISPDTIQNIFRGAEKETSPQSWL